jgi:hypothetical protein
MKCSYVLDGMFFAAIIFGLRKKGEVIKRRTRMRNSKLFIASLLLSLVLTCCYSFKSAVYSDIKLRNELSEKYVASKETIESLLTEVWFSGFLRKNELTFEEILDNSYGVFCKARGASLSTDGNASYIKSGHLDKIMLNRKLFTHLESNFGGKCVLKRVDKRIRATLVHELFHDFWYNILDHQKRILFSIEAEIFYEEMLMVKTKEDKLRFLYYVGLKEPTEDNFEPFETLLRLKDTYSPQKFFGTELYSIIAEKVFSGEMIIPKQFRKFYNGIISETVLFKNTI